MTTVERVKMVLKEQGIPVSKMEKDLGFSNGYIGQLKKGTIRDDRLMAIADYLGVSFKFLSTGESHLAKDLFRSRGKIAIQIPHDEKLERELQEIDDLYEELQILRDNPDTRTVLKGMKGMTPEQIQAMGAFIASLKGNQNAD